MSDDFLAELKGNLPEGFEIIDEVAIGDLTDLKQEKDLIPPTKDVRFLIKKVEPIISKDKTYRQLNLQLNIVDGIDVAGIVKYKNKPLFEKVCYYADPQKYTKDYFKKRQHLVQLKVLASAVGIDLANMVINDTTITALLGKEVLGTVFIKQNNFTTKEGIKVSEQVNGVKDFKRAEPKL